MLKKITACMLVVVMLLSVCLMQVSAEGYGISPLGTTIFYVENGWNIYSDELSGEPMPIYSEIGNYCFKSGYHGGDSVGLFAEKDGRILLLDDVYELGEVTDLDAFNKAYLEYNDEENRVHVFIRMKGDANQDKSITIEDSLKIQKVVAKVESPVFPPYESAPGLVEFDTMCHDYDDDGEITIADVVGTQLYLARKV